MIRKACIIRLKKENLDKYKILHANVWPDVLNKIRECNIRNYSIFYREGYLFSFFEYIGEDYKADMKKMADDKTTREWWKITDPCQMPVETASQGEWWSEMEEVFHTD